MVHEMKTVWDLGCWLNVKFHKITLFDIWAFHHDWIMENIEIASKK